jgi:hypothetical protein
MTLSARIERGFDAKIYRLAGITRAMLPMIIRTEVATAQSGLHQLEDFAEPLDSKSRRRRRDLAAGTGSRGSATLRGGSAPDLQRTVLMFEIIC